MRLTRYFFQPRNWCLALLAAGTLVRVQAQTVAQGFEGSAADTWAYTPTPATYNVPADNDQWAVLRLCEALAGSLPGWAPRVGAA